jgi:hypothetical protein
MADRIIFLAGHPSELISGPFVPQQMVEDLLVVGRLPSEVIDRLTTALDSIVGFLNKKGLKQLVQDTIPDERAASAVLSAFQNLRPERVNQILASLRDWRQADASNAQRLPDETFAAIQENLTRLIRNYPAWERFRKARRLASVTGNKARQVELICDARPVFDQERQQIEGFVPLTTLKVIYDTQTEEMGCIELLLSADLLKELLEKANKAQQKMRVIRDSLNQCIPDGLVEPTE